MALIHHITPWSHIKAIFDNVIAANQYICILLWPGSQFSTSRTEILVFGNFRHFREIEGFPWKCKKLSYSPKLIILVPEYHKKPSNLEFLKLILPIISFQVNLWINGNVYCIYVNTARFYEALYLGPYW